MESLEILPVRDPKHPKNRLKRVPHAVLPDIAKNCCLLIVGKVRSSKSTIISNLMLHPKMYKDLFEHVIIISPTASQDATSRFLVQKYHENVHNEYDDGIIDSLIARQTKFPVDKRPLTMLIVDDSLGIIPRNAKLWYLCSRYRHYNICMIVTSQAFKQVPPILRVNASDVLVCWNLADVEVEKIADEYGSLVGTEKQFIDLYKQQIQKDPYTFLYLDFETGHVYKNFITRLV